MPKRAISQFEGECAPNIGLHFRFDVSDEDFEDHWCGFVPCCHRPGYADTCKPVQVMGEREEPSFSNDKVPDNILLYHKKTLLCKWLCRFMAIQIEDKEWDTLPPKTLHASPSSCRFTAASHSAKGLLQHHQHHKQH